MKLKGSLLVFSLVVCLAACSTLTTSMDYDRAVNFSQFKTWAPKDDGSIKNPLLAKRLENALIQEFAKKGLQRNDANPDLWAVGHARLSKEVQINTYNTGWGYGWGWGGGMGMTTSTVQEIPVGTLIVDLVDANRKQLVWRGTASDTLNPSSSAEDKEKHLQEAIAKMFEAYPPGAGK